MMMGFEQFVIELNYELHQMGLLNDTKYISGFKLIASGIITIIILIAFDVLVLSNEKYQERIIKYMPVFTIVCATLLLIILKAYIAILISALLIGFLIIVVSNKKYEWLKDMIEKFF